MQYAICGVDHWEHVGYLPWVAWSWLTAFIPINPHLVALNTYSQVLYLRASNTFPFKQQEHTQHNDLFPAFFNLDQIRIKLKAVNLRSRGIVEVSVQAEHESGV